MISPCTDLNQPRRSDNRPEPVQSEGGSAGRILVGKAITEHPDLSAPPS